MFRPPHVILLSEINEVIVTQAGFFRTLNVGLIEPTNATGGSLWDVGVWNLFPISDPYGARKIILDQRGSPSKEALNRSTATLPIDNSPQKPTVTHPPKRFSALTLACIAIGLVIVALESPKIIESTPTHCGALAQRGLTMIDQELYRLQNPANPLEALQNLSRFQDIIALTMAKTFINEQTASWSSDIAYPRIPQHFRCAIGYWDAILSGSFKPNQ
jgi:hypothetical protein